MRSFDFILGATAGRIFDLYRKGIYATLSEGKNNNNTYRILLVILYVTLNIAFENESRLLPPPKIYIYIYIYCPHTDMSACVHACLRGRRREARKFYFGAGWID